MRIAVVTPVFNERHLPALFTDLSQHLAPHDVDLVVVDDGSNIDLRIHTAFNEMLLRKCIHVTLTTNLGHQRAIAVGLQCAAEGEYEAIVIMDADGEDKASDIPRLLAKHAENPSAIVCARRAERSERLVFRIGYRLYKLLFRMLCGRTLEFGSFCLIPMAAVRRITTHPGAWNHLAATLLRSRAQIETIDTKRGKRYGGRSSQNITSLAIHGLAAIAVFSDAVIARLSFVGAVSLLATCVMALSVAVGRLTTTAFIPGFATTVILFTFSLSLQILFFCLIVIVVLLSGRSAPAFIVERDAKSFIASKRTLLPNADISSDEIRRHGT